MKKYLALVLVVLLSVAMLSGCQNAADEPTATEMTEPVAVRVMALKGPTSMGMVHFMKAVDDGVAVENEYSFEIVGAPDEVSAALVQGKVDIAAVPANLASVLYNNTDGKVQVLAINTLGVLNLVENGESVSSIEDLRGKTVYASGKGATPEYALNFILEQNGINVENDVTIEWKSEHAECLAALMANENAVALLPQPFATVATIKNENIRIALDLTEQWDMLEQESALITGVVVVNREFADQNPSAVKAFCDRYKESVEFVNTNVEEAAKLIGDYEIFDAKVAEKAIPKCNITFISGAELVEKLSGYLNVLMEQNPKSIGGTLPGDDFYYGN